MSEWAAIAITGATISAIGVVTGWFYVGTGLLTLSGFLIILAIVMAGMVYIKEK